MNKHQQERAYFELISEEYSASDENEESLFWQQYDLRRIRSILPEERSCLMDWGCGAGTYSTILSHDFRKSIIIDWAFTALSTCNQRMRHRGNQNHIILCGDIRYLAFRKVQMASFILA